MNPFMKPLYQEFEENLYRLFSLTLDDFRKFEADHGADIDEEFASIFEKLGPLHLREAMNWKIIALAAIHEERKTGKRTTLDAIGAFAWTLGLQIDDLSEQGYMEQEQA